MAFAVEDFRDLLALLDLHPEWQAELRRRVQSDDMLALPGLVRQLIEAQANTEHEIKVLTERVDALTERMDALTVRMDALTERMDALTVRMDVLTERVDALTRAVADLTTEVKVHSVDLGTLKGDMLEIRYRERAPAYFNRLARRLHVIDTGTLAERLDDAVDSGQLTVEDRDAVLLADLVLTGRLRDDKTDIYMLAEVSFGIGTTDVVRATERAAALQKLGRRVIPVVAGRGVNPEATELAEAHGVAVVLDGRVVLTPV